MTSANLSSQLFVRSSPGARHRSTNSAVTLAEPRNSARTPSPLPNTNAAPASPDAASSTLPGSPLRTSALTTSAASQPRAASTSPPTAERGDNPRSNTDVVGARRNAAWTRVPLVLSAYAGLVVANSSWSGTAGALDSAARPASTASVTGSSSKLATVRVPVPPPCPTNAPIWLRSSRQYGRYAPHETIPRIVTIVSDSPSDTGGGTWVGAGAQPWGSATTRPCTVPASSRW